MVVSRLQDEENQKESAWDMHDKKTHYESCSWKEVNPEIECNVEEKDEVVRGRQRCGCQAA